MRASVVAATCCAALLGSIGLPRPAAAYVTLKSEHNGVDLRWGALPMRFNILNAAAPGVSAAATQAAVRAAYRAWSDVTCSYYDSLDLGVVDNEWGNDGDGVNTNTWLPGWPTNDSSSVLGITLTRYEGISGKINDADTQYNPNNSWATTGSLYAIDVQAVATHEIGHQLGLDHPPIPDATMYYATGQGNTQQRSLHSDDIAGICFLYPSGQQPPPECTPGSNDCAPNETCQAGKCVLDTSSLKGYGGPCAAASECSTGLCLQSASASFCSQLCDSEPCPNDDKCELAQSDTGQLYNVCLPNTGSEAQPLGSPCQNDIQCTSEICVSVPGRGYLCSQTCNLSPDNCPDGYRCAQSNVGGLCIPDDDTPITPDPPPDTPPPPAKKDLGEPCDGNEECQSGICGKTATGGFCTQLCEVAKEKDCPQGFDCLQVTGSDQGACMRIADAAVPGSLGAACKEHDECDSKICAIDANGQRFCTVICDPKLATSCPDRFECVEAGDKHACQPESVTAKPDDGDSSGCQLGSGPAAPWWLIAGLGWLLLARRRRRRG